MLGGRLLAVTEARHWHGGERAGDSESLLHFWLHSEGLSPVEFHGRGDELVLDQAEPYGSYDLQEDGKTIVAPAQQPDLLAGVVGQRLRSVTPVFAPGQCLAGVLLRFERQDVLVISIGDEWLLTQGEIPPAIRDHVTTGEQFFADGISDQAVAGIRPPGPDAEKSRPDASQRPTTAL